MFIRSEWNLIGRSWPCTAFTRLADLRELQCEYVKDRDIMLAIGTTNPERTSNPYHRGRLLTVYTIWPGLYRATKDLVPPESWEHNVLTRGTDKWAHGVPARRIFQLRRKAPWPDAHDICPLTYRALGDPSRPAYGRAIRVKARDERAAILELPVAYEDYFTPPQAICDYDARWTHV